MSIDSRTVKPGQLFVAFAGERQDGHAFVTEALACGASAALVQRAIDGAPWADSNWNGAPVVLVPETASALTNLALAWRQGQRARVVGVTGSVGKTTAKEVIGALLTQRFNVLRSEANLNTDLGLPMTLMDLSADHDIAVLEMGMHDLGEIRQLARIGLPEVGVVTNVLPTHLERLGTIERVAKAKRELVEALPRNGLAILNADDERVRLMADACAGRSVLVGTSPKADLRAVRVTGRGLDGTECEFAYEGRSRTERLQLFGNHSVYPAMAAIAVAMHFGFTFEEAADGMAAVRPGPRLALVSTPGGITIIDDTYNASPASTIAALDFLGQLAGRHVAVLGDMLELASFEEEGHRLVGQRVPSTADWLLAIGPRARIIGEEAAACGMSRASIECFENSAQAIQRLREGLLPGDYVLVKGSHAMQLDGLVAALQRISKVA